MVRASPELIRREVDAMRRGTSRPFGINIIPAAIEPDLLEEQVETCIELHVPVMALFWDLRVDLVHRFRDTGICCRISGWIGGGRQRGSGSRGSSVDCAGCGGRRACSRK